MKEMNNEWKEGRNKEGMKESKKEKHKNKVRRRNIKRKCAFLRGL
jgi:hypothetical protein